MKKPANPLNGLVGIGAWPISGSNRLEGIFKFSAQMNPATDNRNIRQLVVHFITVRMENSFELLQEQFRMDPGPAGLVLKQNDLFLPVATGSVHPHITE
ncbi:hypothetical protein SDC9_116600 [bioreactor metagenome]|uniref:Uncharacterized protein n=1 Tax=bioreactor metagenome TaxID=1076179 RepID=A0A645BWJ8_9ZZZZ